MATIDHKGMVHGTAGSVIYREYRGKNIIQGKTKTFRQTEKTKRSATEFGLSSSTAAVIRTAFEPAYFFKDGTTAYRSTQQVYRSILNNVSGEKGKRDLHDGNLSFLQGLDFNANSKLHEVLQMSHEVSKSANGVVSVTLGSLNTQTDIKRPKNQSGAYMKYRIRFMLVAFNFREEYYENLGVKDIDLEGYQTIEGQVITFTETVLKDCLALVSMSLMLYSPINQTNESILLNNAAFSPCAIIGTFESEKPSDYPLKEVHTQPSAYPGREENIKAMFYKGNLLMLKLNDKTSKRISMKDLKSTKSSAKIYTIEKIPDIPSRKRISFAKKIDFRL
ncbi:hypothetical protein ADIARSV_2555 [Arcticibacter svalbardensis MN12-7]|uniref:Uncharacterized protein n=1 Tax=Arcticibacter svalbardensis MN12-7 TaxID=1150600 RepID=R9GZB2_9SPHI|nr:hypothetical protein [Arcticibacter svalbardensis]EOR94314.1 hypothetical protein ADIARSV_2555 [Arcticibacter svalbardensis MN12-7]